MWVLSFIFVVFVCCLGLCCRPLLGRPRITSAPVMPRSANVDSEGFEMRRGNKRAADGEIAYHISDKRLTCSDRRTDATSTTRPYFQGAAIPRSCDHFRHGTCAVLKDSAYREIV